MNPLFQAHCPQRGYLTKLCDHSYCSILSVAELRRSPDQVVAPFTHSHAAYELLLPLTPMPIILQGTDVYFGRPGMVYPVQSGVRHGQALEQCDVANISLEVSPNFMVQRLREKGLDGAQFGPMFAVSERLRRFLRLFQEEFHGRRDEADLRCLAALVISELIECGCRPQPRPAQAEEQSADTLGAMEEFIYLHYTQPLTIDGLSAQCGMQRNHFITAFKRRFGETPCAHRSPAAGEGQGPAARHGRHRAAHFRAVRLPVLNGLRQCVPQGYRPHAGRVPRYAAV